MSTQTEVRELAARGDLSFLDPDQLQEWVVEQRWFGAKGRQVSGLEVLQAVPLRDDEPLLVLALIAARYPAGTHDLYQVPLGVRHTDEGWTDGVIAEAGNWTIYDGLADPELGRELLQRMRQESVARAGGSTVTFRWLKGPDLKAVTVRPMGVEQSNSSMVFDDALVLKSFRRLEPGVNPELELLRFLDQHGFTSIAPLAGWYEYEGRLVDSTLGILQEYLKGARDGWALAVEKDGMDPDELVGQLDDLGAVTGRMHSVLGSDASDPAFAPEEPSDEALALITATVDEEIERIFKNLPPDEEEGPVATIRGRSQDVRERLGQLSRIGAGGRVIRTHGDYHLGQVMLTERGWVVLDFEGEPARTLPERRQKRSPLRDVAGMLRSFSYVAAAGEILGTRAMPEDWESRARAAFLQGYFRAVDPALLPPGQDSTEKLLSVFELEKAVYELNYEINNRPDWVGIPVASILRLLEAQ
jgi:trehalose synthase-fused probable maltokinase